MAVDAAQRELLKARYLQKLEELKGNRKELTKEEVEASRVKKEGQKAAKRKKIRQEIKSAKKGNLNKQIVKFDNVVETETVSSTREVKSNLSFEVKDPLKEATKGMNKKKVLTSKLKELERNEQMVKGALEKGSSKDAVEIHEKHQTEIALAKVTGKRVRDDKRKLKKSIKRIDKSKEKSTRKWAERKESVEFKQKVKQQRRERNLQSRKDEKSKKKLEKMRKKGRHVDYNE